MTRLEKILLKAAHKSNLKELKTFSIRNVDTSTIQSLKDLKSLIRGHFPDDIEPVFDVGYIQGSCVVRVRSKEDIAEMWSDIRKSKSVCLWCDGLKPIEANKKKQPRRKRKNDHESDSESDEERPKRKKKQDTDEKVDELMDVLKSKHGSKYSFFQFRVWAELLVGRLHHSVDAPPENNSMFQRAGSGGNASKGDTSVVKVVAEAASAITHAISGSPKGGQVVSSHSPAKLIESRSKLYKQLSELQNLKTFMSETEYETEKETIMNLLHQLKPKVSI